MLKFSSKPISEHAEVPLPDEGRWEEIVSRSLALSQPSNDERISYVVSVGSSRDPRVRRAQLAEITSLVKSQGDRIAGEEICHLSEPNPRTLVGKGTAREMAARARAAGATMLVVDAELTPSQARNLEDIATIPICDREAVILNVFLRHARTRRAKIQVEVAQLEYLRPRIRGVGLDMDQQTGATTKARGPGETASELLARKIDTRLEELKKALRKLETSSRTQRQERDACRRIVLAGYTNAGKTSLMNALTSAELAARDMPFETLDTTSRCLTRHGGDVLLSDTVGFIRRLPQRLLASFESTLAEVTEASLLVIVVDVSDYERELHLETTHDLLAKIGAATVPRYYVFNKIDRLSPEEIDREELARSCEGHPFMTLSTNDEAAVAALKEELLGAARRDEEEVELLVPYGEAERLRRIYGTCRVLETSALDASLRLRVRGSRAAIGRVR